MSNPTINRQDNFLTLGGSRRDFLGSCGAHLAMAALSMPLITRLHWTRSPYGTVVAREPFGTLEKVADGVWALISTPLSGDRTTLSNGGIIAGRNGVLAIEGFNQPAGAMWLAGKAKELTGKWPTHVVLTHYHGDHANGLAGYATPATPPLVLSTERTRALVIEKNRPADEARAAALKDASVIPPSGTTSLDLGGRTVRIVSRGGHTDSDVSVELLDPNVVFGGDLLWNAMIPNFVDTVPTRLARSVREMKRTAETTYIPGHGGIARLAEYERYEAMLGEIEGAARAGYVAGLTTAEVAAKFKLTPSLGEWVLFSPAFYTRAFDAWYRELKG